MLKPTEPKISDLNESDDSEHIICHPRYESRLKQKSIPKKWGKRKHPEGDLQISCLNWFKMAYRKYQHNIFAIPNQLARKGRNAQFAAKQGVKSGIPDLMLAWPVKPYSGLFIEMKAAKGRLSPAQKEMALILATSGYQVAVCHSFDEFKNEIEKYLGK